MTDAGKLEIPIELSLGEEDLRAMMEEFTQGMRPITFDELDTLPEGQSLKYVGATASKGLKDLVLAIVHKIETLGNSASLRVGIDDVILDQKNEFKRGDRIRAARSELYTVRGKGAKTH